MLDETVEHGIQALALGHAQAPDYFVVAVPNDLHQGTVVAR
jgi:hypothetical protein